MVHRRSSLSVAWREAVKPALLAFLKLEQHLVMSVAFTVPYGDASWPKAAWGIRWASTPPGCGISGETIIPGS